MAGKTAADNTSDDSASDTTTGAEREQREVALNKALELAHSRTRAGATITTKSVLDDAKLIGAYLDGTDAAPTDEQ